jgi:molybdopterin molybdotransferase
MIAAPGDGPQSPRRDNVAVSANGESVSQGLLGLQEAREIVVAAASAAPLEAEEVAVGAALGRVLAEDVVAAGDVPPFANSAMDGFAVTAGPEGRELRVIGEARAGHPAAEAVGEGEAVRISTGAPLPAGATSVVPVEQAEESDGRVTLRAAAPPHGNVRDAGEDLRAGERVLTAGTALGPAEVAIAVTAGRGRVTCARRPRVAVLATGDELAPAGADLGPGQIHDSNLVMLATLAAREGAHALQPAVVADDRAGTEDALRGALDAADVVVASGGVSVGPHDHVKPALEALGVRERFWRVALKPGKPVWFGTRDGVLVFGLPGNPVSAAVCFLMFVRPALRALAGAPPWPTRRRARLAAAVPRNRSRDEAVRVALEVDPGGLLEARVTGPQGSHMLSSLLGADGLALVPAGDGELPAGAVVEIEPI